jgi:hypothetical protein
MMMMMMMMMMNGSAMNPVGNLDLPPLAIRGIHLEVFCAFVALHSSPCC